MISAGINIERSAEAVFGKLGSEDGNRHRESCRKRSARGLVDRASACRGVPSCPRKPNCVHESFLLLSFCCCAPVGAEVFD